MGHPVYIPARKHGSFETFQKEKKLRICQTCDKILYLNSHFKGTVNVMTSDPLYKCPIYNGPLQTFVCSSSAEICVCKLIEIRFSRKFKCVTFSLGVTWNYAYSPFKCLELLFENIHKHISTCNLGFFYFRFLHFSREMKNERLDQFGP